MTAENVGVPSKKPKMFLVRIRGEYNGEQKKKSTWRARMEENNDASPRGYLEIFWGGK